MSEAVAGAAFRASLAQFASGVTIITTRHAGETAGFTATAFSSVSLSPPLVLVCVGKTASAYDHVIAGSHFGVSILAEGQAWIALQFARQGIDRFEGVPTRRGAGDVPLIEGALVQLECRLHALHDAGDHTIVIGEVLGAHLSEGRPLLHHARRFGSFSAEPSESSDAKSRSTPA